MSIAMNILPPTVNTLDPLQRTRLLKSSKKLGRLLGATPHVLDPDLLSTRPSSPRFCTCTKRADTRMFFSHSTTSSITSLTGSIVSDEYTIPVPRTSLETVSRTPISLVDLPLDGNKKAKRLSRPLVLRLDSMASLPPKNEYDSAALASATISQNSQVSPSLSADAKAKAIDMAGMPPPSPLFDVEQDPIIAENKICRKRMAKLTHTLGEPIPPELVFSQHQKSHSDPEPLTLRRKLSKHRPQNPVVVVPKSNTTDSTLPSDARTHRRRCQTIGSSSAAARIFRSPSLRPEEAPFSSVCTPISSKSVRAERTNENEWSGEWSIKDAERRAMVLRNLKSR